MKSLLKFELYKIFKQKGIYITAAVLMGLIVFFMTQMPRTDPSVYTYYKDFEGPVSEQDTQLASERFNEMPGDGKPGHPDELEAYRDLAAVGIFRDDQKNKLKAINQQISRPGDPSSYDYRRLRLEKEMVQAIDYRNFYYQWPVEQMQDYINTDGFIFLSALILIGLASIFSRESATGVDQYILSTRHGRKTIVHAKLIAALIFVCLVAFFSLGFDVLFWMLTAGNYGWLADIHSIPKYRDSPYAMTMLPFFLLKAGFHLFAGCTLAIFVLLVSALCKNSLISFVVSGFVFGFPFAAETFGIAPDWLLRLFPFTWSSAMQVDDLFSQFHTVNVFGFPILDPIINVVVLSAVTLLILILLYRLIRRKQIYS
jgi:ABC-type transport system involved in multi-copper enzyme maturation permease subunit